MSVTVFIKGKHGVRHWQPGAGWFLLPLVLVAAGVGLWKVSNDQLQDALRQVAEAQKSQTEDQEQVQEIKQLTQTQLATLALRLGRMQAQMNRLESLGITLADKAELTEQFDFSSEVGLGGANADQLGDVELKQLLLEMEQLALRLQRSDEKLSLLETVDRNHHIDLSSYLSGRPIAKGWQSSDYGMRNDPFTGRPAMHKGIDFAGTEGGDVVATGAGVVTYSGEMFGYGNLVEIDHGNGLKTRYGHNKSLLVKAGQVVSKGDVVAELGNTGRSTGPHVHYEVLRNDRQVDPNKYVYRKPRS
ncbi:Murein DD-endopeptidase MepM and murein hydrolase activator NlpD, contain LysM domain [Ferrimonas sediminum]|uniref:Murein DD-endopeptidase MepM and murein hydrolase activator NlpD, contain LysM domain n=1 Tax=Ferrimonas sediminum TaxID=718193 RepID=A0A1G8KGE0_9GAMM|nr:M23 family metallopeptidase [Ferrimonas sediminum]SDI42491.1 Murein DD-endopeptidase MepM and murein hydrolase activator NlpD, contain LysM domain [Ferrimonas sediminum]